MDTTPQSTEDTPRRSLSRNLRLVIVGLVVARGVVGLCVTPLFEGWDEYQHVAYIVHIQETGRRAILNETLVPSSMLAAIQHDFPQPEAARVQMPNVLKPPSYESYWRLASNGAESTTPRLAASEVPPHDLKLYQAQHSWWYYVLVSPFFQAMGGVNDLRSSVTGLRLLNLAFTVGAVWIALGVVSKRVRSPRTAGWIALLIGVQPLLVMNGIRVSSDAAGVLFSVAAVAEMMTLAIDERRLVRRSCRIGVLVGLAILMKASNFAILPAMGAAWIFAVVRTRPAPRVAFGSVAAIGLILGGLIGPDLAHNLSTYGIATPIQEALENRAKGRGFSDMYQAFREFHPVAYGRWLFGQGLFVQGNWSFVLPINELTTMHWQVLELAALGLSFPAAGLVIRRLIARARKQPLDGVGGLTMGFDSLAVPLLCLAVCVGFHAGLVYHALQSALAWGVSTTGPWYASPALPWFLVLIGVGASCWHRFVAPGFVAAIVLLSIAAEQTSWFVQMLPVYSGGAEGWAALNRITSLQVGFLSTTTCILATVVGLGLFLTAVRSIALASDGVATEATRSAWLTIGRKRERIDASAGGVPAPAGRKAADHESPTVGAVDHETWR